MNVSAEVKQGDRFARDSDRSPLRFTAGDRIRINYWVVPREGRWHYGTVLEVGRHCARILWDAGYQSIDNLRAIPNKEVPTMESPL